MSANRGDPVIITGHIITLDPALPRASAMAVRDGRILAVGTLAEITAAVGAARVEAVAGTILPGFTDAHLHMQRGGIKLLEDMGEGDVTLDDFIAQMLETGNVDGAPGVPSLERSVEGLRRIQPLLHALGFTGVIDPAVTAAELAAYQAAHEVGELTMRVVVMPELEVDQAGAPDVDASVGRLAALGVSTGFGDDLLRLGAVKVYFDGEGMMGDALLDEPWPHSQHHGRQRLPLADYERLVEFCALNGWSVGTHAVGGAAVTAVIDAYEAADRLSPIAGRQFQVIHGYLEVPVETMRRAAALDVVASLQPSIFWANGPGLVQKLGARAERLNPMRSWLDAGASVALGSDGPFFAFDPRMIAAASVTRKVKGAEQPLGAQEAITMEEVLVGYTTAAAAASFAGDRRGALKSGYLADWIVMDADPTAVSVDVFTTSRVLRTVVGGATVFEA